jgi:hypothetical protein
MNSSPLTTTLQYEQLQYRFIDKIFCSSSLVTPEYTVMYDDKDESTTSNFGGVFACNDRNYQEKIQEIGNILRAQGRKPTLYITPDATPHRLNEVAQSLGYIRSFTDAWMFFDQIAHIILPEHVLIREVSSKSEMETFVELFNRVYSGTDPNEPYGKAPDAWGENLLDSYGKTHPSLSVKYYILQEGGLDAAIIFSVSDGERAGLYSVGTVPERRRKGLSTSITLYAVAELQASGVKEIYLLTEKDTYNECFYKKIGFATRWYATGWTLHT